MWNTPCSHHQESQRIIKKVHNWDDQNDDWQTREKGYKALRLSLISVDEIMVDDEDDVEDEYDVDDDDEDDDDT